MAHRKSLEALNRTLQDLRNNTNVIGGVLLKLLGDFRETLPVILKSTPAGEINACLKKCVIWEQVKIIKLTTNMRAQISGDKNAQEFSEKLLEIGERMYRIDENTGQITLTNELCNVVETTEQLINYSSHEERHCQRHQQHRPGNNSGRKENLQVNRYMTNEQESINFPTAFLNSLNIPGIPKCSRKLKVGSQIILLRNLNSPKRDDTRCNGTRFCIKQLQNNIIEASIMTDKEKGQIVFIPWITLISNGLPFTFKHL
ncbi:hypothetical protein EVAR_75946_1 [Eumeta japonica]|uniref:ATP-dependent DNA helicase n=1 Tax=Eumeta variegata TaxID=151549 RepID=A0A4C1UXQ2_EUMVA|nr:hypothetical protein EVAR_75946_1 [Eumeta japonica]